MNAPSFRRESCRVCGAVELEHILQLEPTPPGDYYVPAERLADPQPVYPLDLVLCRVCSLVQLADVVSPKILYGGYIYRTSISLGLAEHYAAYADEVIGRAAAPAGALVVDIGSNDGTLLACFAERGLRVLGIDPARDLAAQAARAGIETLPTYFSRELAIQLREDRGPATIVTANNVIANIDDVDDLVEGVRTLLAPDGLFVFETGYLVDLVHQTILDNIYHEHLSYFSVRTLDACFRRRGMELIDVRRVATKGGSLRGAVQRSGGPHRRSPGVDELAALEAQAGVDRPEVFKAWAAVCEGLRDEVAELARDLAGRGRRLAGYGASVGVTTLVYYFGLGPLLGFLVDDNALRHGLYSPGFHLPVLAPETLYERRPDDVFVLPWRYADVIVGKHERFLRDGGRFVIPLPEVRTVGR